LFTAVSSQSRCSSAICASAANTVSKDIDILRKQLVTPNHVLKKLYYGVSNLLLVSFCIGLWL
jgi:hypothetical protein